MSYVKWAFWSALLVILVGSLIGVASHYESRTSVDWGIVTSSDNISSLYRGAERRAVRKSRESAVMVQSTTLNFFGGTSTSSGTYFIANERPYIITVQHGIHGPCWLIRIHTPTNIYECKKITAVDEINDYAIIELTEKLDNRRPMKIPEDLPHGPHRHRAYSLLNKIVYTGYPNVVGPLTLRGDVVGYTQREQIYIFSHAYGGASGSGVFTQNGEYIGYVTAIDVGATEYGIDILENIVLVSPSFNVDWAPVLEER